MTSEITGIGGSLTRAQPKCVAEYPVPVLNRKKQDEIVNILDKCKFVIDSRKENCLNWITSLKPDLSRCLEIQQRQEINLKLAS